MRFIRQANKQINYNEGPYVDLVIFGLTVNKKFSYDVGSVLR